MGIRLRVRARAGVTVIVKFCVKFRVRVRGA